MGVAQKNDTTELVTCGMGFNITGYPGAFTPTVKRIIEKTIAGKVLHIFSGSSTIGDVRIDIQHKNATSRMDVKNFLKNDNRDWDWILLDPPYTKIQEIKEYHIKIGFAQDVELRNLMKRYAQEHTKNILWLDYCAPMIRGFRRKKLWLLLPGGFHNVRVLSWLQKEGDLREFK